MSRVTLITELKDSDDAEILDASLLSASPAHLTWSPRVTRTSCAKLGTFPNYVSYLRSSLSSGGITMLCNRKLGETGKLVRGKPAPTVHELCQIHKIQMILLLPLWFNLVTIQ